MRSPQDVLLKPVVTEKSMGMMEDNKYSFYVAKAANKIEIKHAVESLFKVKVVEVTTMTVQGKWKKVGKFEGKTSIRKKAIVTLKEGDKIQIFEGL